MKILTRPGPGRALKGELAKRMPKFFKAVEKAPDVTLVYPAPIRPETGYYSWLVDPTKKIGGYRIPVGPSRIKPTPGIRIVAGGGERHGELGVLTHELLHHLYKGKNVGKVPFRRVPYPIRSEKIAKAYEHLTPKWLNRSLEALIGSEHPGYLGEKAIEGMEALMRSKIKP